MHIETSRFGLLDLEESVLLNFPWGIPGFEQVKQYVLLEHRQGPFQWLQAVGEPSLAFVICEPAALGFRYLVPAAAGNPISINNWEDLVILVMVSFNREEKKIAPHLHGPLLFNCASRVAYQWTIDSREIKKYLLPIDKPTPAEGPATQ